MPAFVLNKYIEFFGQAVGITKFAETFSLVYILKNEDDVIRETGIKLEPSKIYLVKKQEDLWE